MDFTQGVRPAKFISAKDFYLNFLSAKGLEEQRLGLSATGHPCSAWWRKNQSVVIVAPIVYVINLQRLVFVFFLPYSRGLCEVELDLCARISSLHAIVRAFRRMGSSRRRESFRVNTIGRCGSGCGRR